VLVIGNAGIDAAAFRRVDERQHRHNLTRGQLRAQSAAGAADNSLR